MLPHPQPFFLHLHHIIFLILWVVDFLQLEEGNEQMLAATEMLLISLLSGSKLLLSESLQEHRPNSCIFK